ncbi:MAG: DUF4476 domain-containing protein [bacterium]|nr:DUF4476 domain-containing protein [bacterium]
MKTFLFLILLSSFVIAQNVKDHQQLPNDRPISIIERISYNLEMLERDYLTKLSYRDYVRAKDILIETYDLLLTIPLPPPPTPIEEGPFPISEEEFSDLVESIENESFQENQLSIVQISSRYNFFTVNQVVRVIELFSFSEGKLKTLEYLYPNVLDKFNSHQIINSFTYSSDKEKATEIINRN